MSFEICPKRQSILDCAHHVLILGGPGSGKTTIALHKAKHFIESKLQTNQKVLFLSFSRAAIRQISDRSKDVLSEKLKNISFQTYHSFCWEILGSFSYFLFPNQPLRLVPPHHESVLQNRYNDGSWNDGQLTLFQQEGRICFDLFAEKVLYLFNKSDAILAMINDLYPLIIVDEFQDSDQDQWNLVKKLSAKSQLICLADAEQRIYEWRKNVSSSRIEEVKSQLSPVPLIVDFADENHRSPSNEITKFANAIYKDEFHSLDDSVSIIRYPFNGFAIYLKLQIINAFTEIRKIKPNHEITVAVLGRSNSLVRSICDTLDSTHQFRTRTLVPMRYSVLIDENAVVQAGLNIANFLEPHTADENLDLANALRVASNFYNTLGKATHNATATKLEKWAEALSNGKSPKTKCVDDLRKIRHAIIEDQTLTGDPLKDWLEIRKRFEESSSTELKRISDYARQLRLLRRGSQIADSLGSLWQKSGTYCGAVDAFERALSHEMLLQNYMEPSGCLVMNMHKSKGKEFDAVILVENQYNTFTLKDIAPYMNTRRLVRVAITRARHKVYVLMERANSSPIFSRY